MDLATVAATIPPRKQRGGTCSIATIRAGFDPVDKALFDSYLADSTNWTNRRLADLARAIGFELNGQAFARHRRGECQCPCR
jgi:hypothetical protein